uniref:Uncharacterized protein n=1 Tax=Rhizophora mucronata TaxID=61149 RepID=A0A2P2NYG7_RHIMU
MLRKGQWIWFESRWHETLGWIASGPRSGPSTLGPREGASSLDNNRVGPGIAGLGPCDAIFGLPFSYDQSHGIQK